MMRRSLIAKPNRVGVEAQRRLAGGKERRAEAGNRRQLRRFLAQEQRRPQRRRQFRRDRDADDDAEPDQGGREGQSAPPRCPDRRRGGTVGPRRAMVGDAGAGERERGENAGRPGRRAGGDQTAENRAERHAGRRRGVQPGQDRAAKPPLDPRALGVHGDVDDAAEEPRDDQGDRDPASLEALSSAHSVAPKTIAATGRTPARRRNDARAPRPPTWR